MEFNLISERENRGIIFHDLQIQLKSSLIAFSFPLRMKRLFHFSAKACHCGIQKKTTIDNMNASRVIRNRVYCHAVEVV